MKRPVYKTFISFIAGYAFIFVSVMTCPFNCIYTLDTTDSNIIDTLDDSVLINRPRPVIGNYYVYYGSFHNHSNFSDGAGTPEYAYRYAKYRAGLDFFSLSDHDYYMNDENWDTIKATANAANKDSAFAAFWAFEWTSGEYGHITVVNTDDYCVNSNPGTNTFPALCAWLGARNCIAIFNHPTGINSYGTEFDHFNDAVCEKIVGMELWNKSTPFSVYYYNEGYDSNDNHKGVFDEALTRGWKIGAAGGSDNHEATWGTANDFRLAILAKKLTRADLFAAMQARRFFSTLDKNIALSFTIGGNEMGSTVTSGTSTLEIRASDGDWEYFSKVVLFDKNHDIRRSWNPSAALVTIADTLNIASGDYYYVKITQEDGDEAISSPIWVSDTVSK